MSASGETTRNELVWLASRYVAGELSTGEAAAIEALLETDVAACRAVARAMELNLTIAAAFESCGGDLQTSHPEVVVVESSSRESHRSTRVAGAVMTALAATAVAAAGIALMIGTTSVNNGLVHKDGTDRIVEDWASGEAARNAADDDDSIDSHDDADLDPPDWLLAALTASEAKEQLDQDDVLNN